MLFNPYVTSFEALYDNMSTLTETGIGQELVADTVAHTKGAVVEFFSGVTIAKDCYGIGLIGMGGVLNGSASRYMVDIMVDPAGGTAWQVLIPNILFNSPGFGSFTYFFPIFIRAGSSVGARMQSNRASADMNLGAQLYGLPNRPEHYKVGTYVEAIGADTATTSGASVTPGSNAMGSWALVGTTTRPVWFWQCSGLATDEATMNNQIMFTDVAVGDATNKYLVFNKCAQRRTSAEQCDKDSMGIGLPFRLVTAGTSVYTRSSSSSPDIAESTVVYGIG